MNSIAAASVGSFEKTITGVRGARVRAMTSTCSNATSVPPVSQVISRSGGDPPPAGALQLPARLDGVDEGLVKCLDEYLPDDRLVLLVAPGQENAQPPGHLDSRFGAYSCLLTRRHVMPVC